MPSTTPTRIKPFALIIAVLVCLAGGVARADTLRITHQGGEEVVTAEDLARFDQTGFTTSTIWTDGKIAFEGVPLKVLLDSLGVTRGQVELRALNDYAVTLPVAELEAQAPIIAARMNGAPMPARRWGPYWLVYPYDADGIYRSEVTYSRSIWQLVSVTVMD